MQHIKYGFFEKISFENMLEMNSKISKIKFLDTKYNNLVKTGIEKFHMKQLLSGEFDEKLNNLEKLDITLKSFSNIIFKRLKSAAIIEFLGNELEPKEFNNSYKLMLENNLKTYINLIMDHKSILYKGNLFKNIKDYDFKFIKYNNINYNKLEKFDYNQIFIKFDNELNNLNFNMANDISNSIASRKIFNLLNKIENPDLLKTQISIQKDIIDFFNILENIFAANLFELNMKLSRIIFVVDELLIFQK